MSKRIYNSILFQDRDLALLRGLFESRIMTPGHICSLYFSSKPEATKKRLQKLKAAGLIGERKRRLNEASVLFLTRKAFKVLHDHGLLSEYPPLGATSLERRAQVSELTLRHELEVMDVKAAFHSALAQTAQFMLFKFSTWPLLYQFEAFRDRQGAAEVLVKPDGFIRIHERERDGGLSEHTFFLELDRSTETQEILVARAGCYVDYYKSGGFALRNGADRSAYKEYPFRVLMVLKTAERRNNTAERLLQSNPPIFTQVYLSTLAEVTARPLGPVWIRPLDYREATKGTAFVPGTRPPPGGYRRQSARELFVEDKLTKHRLLMDDTTG
ncbi:MAG: replication-relaxation family protein [Limisphaerales bacterium]